MSWINFTIFLIIIYLIYYIVIISLDIIKSKKPVIEEDDTLKMNL